MNSIWDYLFIFNPTALRTAKTLWSFGHSECNRVKLSKLKIIAKLAHGVEPYEEAHSEPPFSGSTLFALLVLFVNMIWPGQNRV